MRFRGSHHLLIVDIDDDKIRPLRFGGPGFDGVCEHGAEQRGDGQATTHDDDLAKKRKERGNEFVNMMPQWRAARHSLDVSSFYLNASRRDLRRRSKTGCADMSSYLRAPCGFWGCAQIARFICAGPAEPSP